MSSATIVYCVTRKNQFGKFENVLKLSNIGEDEWLWMFKGENKIVSRKVMSMKNPFIEKTSDEIRSVLNSMFKQKGYYRVHVPRGESVGSTTLFSGWL